MLINQELAQEFKEAVKKLYNQFSLKYHAGYPKAFQSLLKLQAFYSSSSVDLDVLNKLLLEAKEVLAGGDAFRITTAYYADLTKAIDLIIDRFTHKKTRLEASLQQVVTPPTETSASVESSSTIQTLMNKMEQMELDNKKQALQQSAQIKEIQSKYDNQFQGLEKRYTDKLDDKRLAIHQLDEANARKIDEKVLYEAQQQHLSSLRRKEMVSIRQELAQFTNESKADISDTQSVRTALSRLSVFSNTYLSNSKLEENDLANRFTLYLNNLSTEQQNKLAKISFSLFNLLEKYDTNGNLLATKKELGFKVKTKELQELEGAIEFLFKGDMSNSKQFFKELANTTQDEDLKIKFRVIKRHLADVNENLLGSDLKSLQKFLLAVYPQADKDNKGINHSGLAKSAYNYGVDLLGKLKQQAAKEQKQEEAAAQPRLGL